MEAALFSSTELAGQRVRKWGGGQPKHAGRTKKPSVALLALETEKQMQPKSMMTFIFFFLYLISQLT